jgi:hypothetical protein
MGRAQGESAGGALVIIHDVAQRTPEWHRLRLGKVTGSVAADMLANGRGSAEAASRRNLRVRLTLERLTGRPQENGYVSAAMQAGIDREPDAYAIYEALTGRLLTSSGFIQHDTLAAGCSLDGYVDGLEGIIEIKAPIAATHLEYLRTGVVPGDYLKQIQHGLFITGAQWCDWLSFNPDFPEGLQVKLVRVQRDEAALAEYEKKLTAFLAEVDREVEALATMTNLVGQLQASIA